jgi:hypothetical protein
MIFKRKKKIDIFGDLPKAPENIEAKNREIKKSGRRAMLVPDTPFTDDPAADKLLANTAKQREQWLEILDQSDVREAGQDEIAIFLEQNYRVQNWWANSIALMYLKWRAGSKSVAISNRNLRLVFELPTSVGLSFNLLNASAIYGKDLKRTLKSVTDERIVLSFTDETRATLLLRKSGESCEVIVEHEFIANQIMLKYRTKYWNDLFTKLIEQVTR